MYDVDFYLIHSQITDEHIRLISEFSATLDNITFHEIRLEDNRLFEKITKYGDARSKKGGKIWPPETYYWYYAHYYLPDDMERIMYIDAGDVVIVGDLGEYYYKDFNNKMFIASQRVLLTKGGHTTFIRKSDYENRTLLSQMLGTGAFCAGTIVLNLPKFRSTVNDGYYDEYIEMLKATFPNTVALYLGDQGLASWIFADEIEYFTDNGNIDVLYRPNNFPVGNFYQYEREDIKFPLNALHYNASKTFKPWIARFDKDEIAKHDLRVNGEAGYAPFSATPTLIEFYELWWDFCKETPIYEDVNENAKKTADALQKYYLPLCESYNKLMVSHLDLEKKHLSLDQTLKSVLDQFPLLSGVSPDSVTFLISIITPIMRDDLQSALDEIYRLADGDIPDEHAESYLTLAQLVCASAEYADGWIFFKKELAVFLLNSGSIDKANEQIKELEELLPDDKEVIDLRLKADAINTP
jgi:lipopolysaccharide biosynthesis glycosyltransferase